MDVNAHDRDVRSSVRQQWPNWATWAAWASWGGRRPQS